MLQKKQELAHIIWHLEFAKNKEQELLHGSTATGTYSGYVGYYNFLNIKASGSTDSEVISNGLAHAKNNGWTDPEISIKAGAKLLAQNYIKDGQDTLYLQKFDVDDSDGALYWHQYMQNVSASVTEGASVKKAYEQLGLLNSSIDFIIPVYENMPKTACPEPTEFGVIYRTHVENIGWQGYVMNGKTSGTSGKSLRLEGININLQGIKYSGGITYQTHVENIGWQEKVPNSDIAGTSGKSYRLEGIKINLQNPLYSGDIEYRTHVQNIGWQGFVKNGAMSGTSGRSLRLEALQIRLTGTMAQKYDIYYRVHCQNFGWMGWAKNGESAGSSGYSYRLEAVQICLVDKGTGAPRKHSKSF